MMSPPRVDILVVDDNPGKMLALRSALEPLGENIVSATSGRDALRHLLERDFATIILDVQMPEMDGFETAQLIRGRPRSAHTPIIFVSAVSLADTDALRGYSLGAVDYIFAPVVPEVLRAKVSVFVELHRKTEEARRHAREVEERTRQLEASQQQLRLAERMAAMGTLSAGLGHDMGNLLLPVQARLESIDRAGLGADTQEALDAIRTCVGHLRRLADGLRLLSLDPERESHPDSTTDLAVWWPDIEPVLRTVLPKGVRLESEIAPEGATVLIARHLLTQAVFNLVQNAADALRGRASGLIRVSATPAPGGGAIRVEVSDDGPGITEDVLRRCLEPFFTTKMRGITTGLGLSLVHGIVRRAGGTLEIRSSPGAGSSFSFELRSAPGQRRAESFGGAVVTVADARLRSLVSSLLRSRGVPVEHGEPGGATAARLWVADGAPGLAARAEEFVRDRPDRSVMVLDESPSAPPSIVALGASPLPTVLGRALNDLIDGRLMGPPDLTVRPRGAPVAAGSPEGAGVVVPA